MFRTLKFRSFHIFNFYVLSSRSVIPATPSVSRKEGVISLSSPVTRSIYIIDFSFSYSFQTFER